MDNQKEIDYAKSLLADGHDIETVIVAMTSRDLSNQYSDTYWRCILADKSRVK